MTKKTILKLSKWYDRWYRGGCMRGEIDEELAALLAWSLRQEKTPTEKQVKDYLQGI